MSGQLRALKNRIRSVESTKKITRAMEMVAAAKLRRFQDMMAKSQPYTEGLEKLLGRLQENQAAENLQKPAALLVHHPFFEQREEKQIAVVLFTSDTGLCGSYNNELIATANKFLATKQGKPLFIGVGKSGITSFKRSGYSPLASFTDLRASRVEEILQELTETLQKIYLEGRADAIYVVYSHFLNLTTYKATVQKLLPFENTSPSPSPLPPGERERVRADVSVKYIFEPDAKTVFQKLVPVYFQSKVRTIFLESFVSEQIARMTAMHLATKNAKEMIDSLVLKRNKARQAAITKELIEIVSGSQALKLK